LCGDSRSRSVRDGIGFIIIVFLNVDPELGGVRGEAGQDQGGNGLIVAGGGSSTASPASSARQPAAVRPDVVIRSRIAYDRRSRIVEIPAHREPIPWLS
jgi:hypothetical protein